ncbi:MAG: hypothetical protein ACYS6K_22380, partial [Planctomycetota bacterium]
MSPCEQVTESKLEVGGIENGCFGKLMNPCELRHIMKNVNDFELLFGCVWLCLFQVVFHPGWHKSGTYEKTSVKLYFSFRRRQAAACFPVGLYTSPIRALSLT